MGALDRVRNFTKDRRQFDVVQAFGELESVRKMALFDRASDSHETFYKSVKLFWPQARPSDAKKLERFIQQRIASNNK